VEEFSFLRDGKFEVFSIFQHFGKSLRGTF
jgi:hypothetical protein